MSKPSPIRTTKARAAAAGTPRQPPSRPAFTPAAPRARHDGWTPEKQVAFIDALAESGCVAEACARVGQSPSTAYRLRRRVDAYSFRAAWDAALDYAIRRLSDAAFSRALHGVARPVFFQGEQVGERRYYDERLTMFLLRYRDPDRYGMWLDRREPRRRPDAQAIMLDRWTDHVAEDAWNADAGAPVIRARAADPTRWLTDAEAAMADAPPPAPAIPRATQAETDARLRAVLTVFARLRQDDDQPDEATLTRLIAEEEARQPAPAPPEPPPTPSRAPAHPAPASPDAPGPHGRRRSGERR
ncbi:MAG: hypothetical protein ABS87_09270 [Sphingomonas sp. SCN 67-18]|uniref:hypothetical protein n=1 Tax=uncultured Sphingomonas sp. TaxID=158754 RepID=UPI00086E3A15|nr:hypothetical protein [Sphingomonas sp. SCN 67-18]ODU20708.1 MAG: hypothetical protein ABS87_09270 [Sphingomonas sp. SCN 67-18]